MPVKETVKWKRNRLFDGRNRARWFLSEHTIGRSVIMACRPMGVDSPRESVWPLNSWLVRSPLAAQTCKVVWLEFEWKKRNERLLSRRWFITTLPQLNHVFA